MATAKKKKPAFDVKLGDSYEVDGILCEVRYVNHGDGWLFPLKDGDSGTLVRTFLAYGKIDSTGEIRKL